MIEAVIFDFGRTLYDPETKDLFPETKTTLDALRARRLKLGLLSVAVSNDTQKRVDQLSQLGIRDYFQAIDIIERDTEGKDFTKILRELGLLENPQKTAVVGDNLKREITAGNRIGAFTIWTTQRLSADWKPQNQEQTPRAIINDIYSLIPLIDSLNSDSTAI